MEDLSYRHSSKPKSSGRNRRMVKASSSDQVNSDYYPDSPTKSAGRRSHNYREDGGHSGGSSRSSSPTKSLGRENQYGNGGGNGNNGNESQAEDEEDEDVADGGGQYPLSPIRRVNAVIPETIPE